MNPVETISKKRTRKISKRDDLDSLQFTQLEDDVEVKEDGTVVVEHGNWSRTEHEHSGNLETG
jgi:hypothetical protein